jgi:hypothetical protein
MTAQVDFLRVRWRLNAWTRGECLHNSRQPVGGCMQYRLLREKLLHSVQSSLKSSHVVSRKHEGGRTFFGRTDGELNSRPSACTVSVSAMEPINLQELD